MFMGGLGHQRHHMLASCHHFSFQTHILSACPTQRRRLILIDAGKCVIEQTASHDANPRNILCCRKKPLWNLFMSFRITSYVLGSFELEIKDRCIKNLVLYFLSPSSPKIRRSFKIPKNATIKQLLQVKENVGHWWGELSREQSKQTGLRNSGSKVTQAEAGPGGKRRRRPLNLSPEKSVEKEGVAAGQSTATDLECFVLDTILKKLFSRIFYCVIYHGVNWTKGWGIRMRRKWDAVAWGVEDQKCPRVAQALEIDWGFCKIWRWLCSFCSSIMPRRRLKQKLKPTQSTEVDILVKWRSLWWRLPTPSWSTPAMSLKTKRGHSRCGWSKDKPRTPNRNTWKGLYLQQRDLRQRLRPGSSKETLWKENKAASESQTLLTLCQLRARSYHIITQLHIQVFHNNPFAFF